VAIGQPASERSEKHERCDEQQRDHADKTTRFTGRKKPLHDADQNEFGSVVVEGHLRLREQEAAEAGTSKEGFHRPRMQQILNYIIDKL
jgi:hypothetical protein